MPLKSEESLTKAIRALTREMKRFNDAHEPKEATMKEAEFGVAEYGESEEHRETREFLKNLEESSLSRKQRS